MFFDPVRPVERTTAMRIRRIYLTAILATAPAAAAAILAAPIASPQHVQFSAAPIHDAPLDNWGNIDGVDMPNLNAVDDIIPGVPNINMPNVKVNPGHVGRPGRGR
jgi:hypothetical protein